MPPLLSDNEASDDELTTNGAPKHTESNVEADVEAKNQLKDDLVNDVARKKGKKAARIEKAREASPEEEDDDDGEEVFEVEAITAHRFAKNELFYSVKWKGYPESDNTWEPERNLTSSTEILAQYHHRIGGAPQPPSKGKDLKKKASKKSLRGESGTSAAEDSPAPPAKRQKRAQVDDSALSDDLEKDAIDNWLPKGSNWENQVKAIQTVERDEPSGDLFIFLEFNNGKKNRVKNGKIRSACPQKLLDFYEAHLNFSGSNSSIAYHTKPVEQEEFALSTDSEA